MKVFATDIDGCIADFDSALISAIHSKFGLWPNYESDMFEVVKRYPSHVHWEIERWIRSEECMGGESFWTTLEAVNSNIAVMTQWVFDGWVPSVVTGRGRHTALATELWLSRKNVPYSNLLFDAKMKKGELCNHLNASFLIEDNIYEAWRASEVMKRVYLLETPGNKGIVSRWAGELKDVDNIHVVKDYREIDQMEKTFAE